MPVRRVPLTAIVMQSLGSAIVYLKLLDLSVMFAKSASMDSMVDVKVRWSTSSFLFFRTTELRAHKFLSGLAVNI